MQDVQNIPNPDVNSTVREDDFGSHSDIEQVHDENEENKIPLPDNEPKPAPIEEPPNPDKPKIDENGDQRERIL